VIPQAYWTFLGKKSYFLGKKNEFLGKKFYFLAEKVVIQGVYSGIHSAENHLITRILYLSA
jgi:hypothetical protein